MKIVFFGTPDYVLSLVIRLHKAFKVKGGSSPIVSVVTQKPKPAGRKKIITYSPVDKWAHKRKVPIYYESKELLEKNVEADLGILAAFGEIIPKKVISFFPHGILNIHPSLLPQFRGASPVQAAIITGVAQAGVTIIKMDEELDHGPIISQFSQNIRSDDTTETLRGRLFEKSAEVLVELLPHYLKGKITPREQDHDQATFTTQVRKEDGFIPGKYIEAALIGKAVKEKWNIEFMPNFALTPDSHALERFIRAMIPWPIAWTKIKVKRGKKQTRKRLKILKAHIEDAKLVLDKVQVEGKKPVTYRQFQEGYATAMFE